MRLRRIVGERILKPACPDQRFPFHVNQFDGIFRERARFGQYGYDRLADIKRF